MAELGRRSEDNTPRSAAAESTQPPQLSVITPVFRTTPPYLHAAFDSLLRENQLAWQWEIQVDGESVDTLPAALLHHPNVRAEANGRWLGPAMTRNRALGRVDAPFVVALDADDLVEPGGLAALVEALSANDAAELASVRTVVASLSLSLLSVFRSPVVCFASFNPLSDSSAFLSVWVSVLLSA